MAPLAARSNFVLTIERDAEAVQEMLANSLSKNESKILSLPVRTKEGPKITREEPDVRVVIAVRLVSPREPISRKIVEIIAELLFSNEVFDMES